MSWPDGFLSSVFFMLSREHLSLIAYLLNFLSDTFIVFALLSDFFNSTMLTIFGKSGFSCLRHCLVILKGVIWCFFKNVLLCIWCNRICWHALMLKKHNLYYCRSFMLRLSQTLRFLQSPSFRQAQSALIGQLPQCILIGRTLQALVGNVMPFP